MHLGQVTPPTLAPRAELRALRAPPLAAAAAAPTTTLVGMSCRRPFDDENAEEHSSPWSSAGSCEALTVSLHVLGADLTYSTQMTQTRRSLNRLNRALALGARSATGSTLEAARSSSVAWQDP